MDQHQRDGRKARNGMQQVMPVRQFGNMPHQTCTHRIAEQPKGEKYEMPRTKPFLNPLAPHPDGVKQKRGGNDGNRRYEKTDVDH